MADGDPHAAHRRRWLIGTVVAVLVAVGLVVGGPWVYARFIVSEPPDVLDLSTPTSPMQAVPTGPIEIDGVWQVTAGSEAGYRLGEVLSGEQTTVVGRTDEVSGTVEIVDGFMTEATITVQAGSISSDQSARDAYFRRALDTTSFPTATFTLTEPVDVSVIGSSAAPMSVAAVGTLTFHGVGESVTATFDVQRTAEGVEVAGQMPVTLADFDLEVPDLGWVVVDPTGSVEVLVQLGR